MSDLIGELSTPSAIAGAFDGDIIAAKTYAQRAEAAADRAESAIPHIGENGNWWIGNTDTGVAGPKYELTDYDKEYIAQTVLESLTAVEGVYA